MKLFHLGDLHLGKRVHEYSMLEEQRFVLDNIYSLAQKEQIDAVLISGDVYDKGVPTTGAVELFDDFIGKLIALSIEVFVISGNHDSPERLAFGRSILSKQKLYISGVFNGKMECNSIMSNDVSINVYMLPFVKPSNIRPFFQDEVIENYSDAIKTVIDNTDIDYSKINILLAHQFVTNSGQAPERCDSETISVGGVDNVEASLFDGFDYVALGHIHRPQKVKRDEIRYSGSLLKYSFSEVNHKKSVTMIEINSKDEINVLQIPIIPMHDMRKIKGPLNKIIDKDIVREGNREDFMYVTLTDEEELIDAIAKVRNVYPNLLKLDFENSRTKNSAELELIDKIEEKTPMQLFKEFYQLRNNVELSDEKQDIIVGMLEEINNKH